MNWNIEISKHFVNIFNEEFQVSPYTIIPNYAKRKSIISEYVLLKKTILLLNEILSK